MNPEVLLKAYVRYQSEDAFRDLVVGTLDEVYPIAFRMVDGTPHLAEQIAVSVYSELAHKASRMGKDVVLVSWLRKRTCEIAASTLRAEGRAVDRAALKREREALSPRAGAQPAPPGLASRIWQTIFLCTTRRSAFEFFLPGAWWPSWMRFPHVAGAAICVFVIVVWWNNPFHRRNPIIESQGTQLTPASFAQLARPEGGGPWLSENGFTINTYGGTNSLQK